MYDIAREAFQLAIDTDLTLIEAYIGRLLGFVYIILTFFILKINIYEYIQ